MPKRFDPQQDLTPIRGQTIRDLQKAGESGLGFRAAAPMSSQDFAGGQSFRVNVSAVALATASGDIASGNVSNPGRGRAALYAMTAGDSAVGLGASVPVFSIYDKTIKGDAGLLIGLVGSKWFVLSVHSCDDLVSPANGSELDFLPPDFPLSQAPAGPGRVRRLESLGTAGAGPLDPPAATPTPAQHAFNSGVGTTGSVSFGGATTAGSLLVAVVSSESTPTPPAGWSAAATTSGRYVSVWYRANAPSVSSVSFSQANATWCVAVQEYTGAPASPTVHTAVTAVTTTSPITSGPVSPTGGTAVVVGGFSNNNSDAFTSPSGSFSVIDQGQAGGTNQLAALGKIGAAGSYTAGVSFPGGDSAWGVIASFN